MSLFLGRSDDHLDAYSFLPFRYYEGDDYFSAYDSWNTYFQLDQFEITSINVEEEDSFSHLKASLLSESVTPFQSQTIDSKFVEPDPVVETPKEAEEETKKEKKAPKRPPEITGIPENLAEVLKSHFEWFEAKQAAINDDTYKQTGPGRKRKHDKLTTMGLRSMIYGLLKAKLAGVLAKNSRKDSLITNYVRTLKKLPYFLIEKTAAKNMYKRNKMTEFIVAFAESYTSFLFSIIPGGVCAIDTFVEFVVIYFPEEKAQALIETLIEQDDRGRSEFYRTQLDVLKARDKPSKKNTKEWVQKSSIFKAIFELALDILMNDDFSDKHAENHFHLKKVTLDFLKARN